MLSLWTLVRVAGTPIIVEHARAALLRRADQSARSETNGGGVRWARSRRLDIAFDRLARPFPNDTLAQLTGIVAPA